MDTATHRPICIRHPAAAVQSNDALANSFHNCRAHWKLRQFDKLQFYGIKLWLLGADTSIRDIETRPKPILNAYTFTPIGASGIWIELAERNYASTNARM